MQVTEQLSEDVEMMQEDEAIRVRTIPDNSINSILARENLEIAKGISERHASFADIKAPETGYAFTRQWKELHGQKENRHRLLFQIMKPVNYEKCFATSLEPDMLVEMIETCTDKHQINQLIAWLRPLSSFKLAELMLPVHLKNIVE